jgi:glutamate N-acetyltransferase/amino-acid N-acetyltransferase
MLEGVRIGVANAGIRYADRNDIVLFEFASASSTAAVFTQNKFCAAPVVVAKQHLAAQPIRALLINAGNANAGTGAQGLEDALSSCAQVARQLDIEQSAVLPFSTGVIGELLPMPKLLDSIPALQANLQSDNWLAAAQAIMTTDTVAKLVTRTVEIGGQTVTIRGIAKGSGMICPNMATMLGFVVTDAQISQPMLQTLLENANEESFNRITVDGDTSTNDALTLTATACSGVEIQGYDDSYRVFSQALQDCLVELATLIVRDAEGANKFVKVMVTQGDSNRDCRAVCYSIAHSPLVKTALYASDPNWGRILMAVGKADIERFDIDKVCIAINGLALIVDGQLANGYSEEKGKAEFLKDEIEISVALGQGTASHHVWTSDLSHDYVSINADYRS